MKLNPFAKKVLEPQGRRRSSSGDLQPPASPYAYRSKRAEPAQPATTSRHAMSWRRRLGLMVLLAAAVALTVNALTLVTEVKLVPLSSSGNQFLLRPSQDYQAAAEQLLSSSPRNRNKLTIDTGQLNQQMQQKFPELAHVTVTIPLLAHRPVVYVEPATPALLLSAENGFFVISNSGKALIRDNGQQAVKQLNLPQLNDQSGLHVALNRQALPAKQVVFIQTVLTQLKALKYDVTIMTLPSSSSELDVQLSGQPYLVKFNLHSDNPRGQAGTFLATIENLKRKNVTPAKYVDVRVDGRAYYQ